MQLDVYVCSQQFKYSTTGSKNFFEVSRRDISLPSLSPCTSLSETLQQTKGNPVNILTQHES